MICQDVVQVYFLWVYSLFAHAVQNMIINYLSYLGKEKSKDVRGLICNC